MSPLDLERTFVLVGGDISMGIEALTVSRRAPMLGHEQYRGPLQGLYMCWPVPIPGWCNRPRRHNAAGNHQATSAAALRRVPKRRRGGNRRAIAPGFMSSRRGVLTARARKNRIEPHWPAFRVGNGAIRRPRRRVAPSEPSLCLKCAIILPHLHLTR